LVDAWIGGSRAVQDGGAIKGMYKNKKLFKNIKLYNCLKI